ncbi:hypothetical protein HKX48_004302 [Thoreauomyces humboldtii]|nr:hypothetical protein HKX48_004302 [Thoreauomyces humboldtii]
MPLSPWGPPKGPLGTTIEILNLFHLFLDKYVEGYLRSIRGLSHGSIGNHVTAAIDVLKYRTAQSSSTTRLNPKANMKIARLMRTRNQEQTLAERERNETRQDSASSGIVWEQVRGTLIINIEDGCFPAMPIKGIAKLNKDC